MTADLVVGCIQAITSSHIWVLTSDGLIFLFDFESHRGTSPKKFREGHVVGCTLVKSTDAFRVKEVASIFHYEEGGEPSEREMPILSGGAS